MFISLSGVLWVRLADQLTVSVVEMGALLPELGPSRIAQDPDAEATIASDEDALWDSQVADYRNLASMAVGSMTPQRKGIKATATYLQEFAGFSSEVISDVMFV